MKVKIKWNDVWYLVVAWDGDVIWINDGQIDREYPPNVVMTPIKPSDILAVKIGKMIFTRKEKGK